MANPILMSIEDDIDNYETNELFVTSTKTYVQKLLDNNTFHLMADRIRARRIIGKCDRFLSKIDGS